MVKTSQTRIICLVSAPHIRAWWDKINSQRKMCWKSNAIIFEIDIDWFTIVKKNEMQSIRSLKLQHYGSLYTPMQYLPISSADTISLTLETTLLSKLHTMILSNKSVVVSIFLSRLLFSGIVHFLRKIFHSV